MISQAEFARQNKWSRSYVTQLKKDGRLVMSNDGKKVLPKESLARIKATEDPNREDVKQRHADERGSGEKKKSKTAEKYQEARARKESAQADIAEAMRDVEQGKLVSADDVKKAGFELGTHIRTALENMPDQLAPELAPISDPARVHAVLVEYFENLLADVSQQLGSIAEVK